MSKVKNYITTGEAAAIFDVDPDTVLRWIKSGEIQAIRTPGGHYRINRNVFLNKMTEDNPIIEKNEIRSALPYCWEFNGQKNCDIEDCKSCLVYKTHARYCFEMIHIPTELGHLKRYCESSCHT